MPRRPPSSEHYFSWCRGPPNRCSVVPEVHASTIEAIVKAPRSFFIPDGFVTGCPVLDVQGRVLGLCLAQMVDGRPTLTGGHPSGIILPAADVADQARQALAKL